MSSFNVCTSTIRKPESPASSTQQIPASSTKQTQQQELLLASPLVSACRHLLQPNGSIRGDQVADAILPQFPDLCSSLPSDTFAERRALLGVDSSKRFLHHARIRSFILEELGPKLHALGLGRGDRIALVLPNGPELALAILGVAHWASCLPLNANGAPSELKKDLKLAKASIVVGIEGESSIREIAMSLNIPFCGLAPSQTETGIFHLIPHNDIVSTTSTFMDDTNDEKKDEVYVCSHMLPNRHDDEVLVLFTSGTTGNKKLVPHKLGDMLIAAACIAVSWNLTPYDVNCNLMPLFHVGGIVRQVFAPLLSAGSVICCPSFDPQLFWQLLLGNDSDFTWYYAAPTMHQVLLASMPSGATPRLRMIANAAGGLLPSLAQKLRKTFGGANVLPSYGMTECMPISSPPYNYDLTKPGTSGVAVGPEICIFNSSQEALPPGKEGSICVRGRPCFRGYGGEAKNETFAKGGWFNTGDLGYLDCDGYLYITGRSKEVINRGGEIISPMEVEEEVLSNPHVMACAAFSTSHDMLQEVVGIVIVPSLDMPKIDLPSLHDFLQSRLATAKWPQALVFMDALPKSHTNKLLRVKLGQRLGLPEMNDSMFPVQRTFEATCPPQGTPVATPISCKPVSINAEHVQSVMQEAFGVNDQQLVVAHHPNRFGSLVLHSQNLNRQEIIRTAKKSLDAFLIPTHVCLYPNEDFKRCSRRIPQSTDAVGFLEMVNDDESAMLDPMIRELQQTMQTMLNLDCLPSPHASFFQVGGTSLLASQLASRIRKTYQVSFSGADIFRHNKCFAMVKKIRSGQPGVPKQGSNGDFSKNPPATAHPVDLQGITFDATRLEPQKNVFTGLFQLIPGFAIFPLWYFARFFLFFMTLLEVLNRVPGERNMSRFIGALVVYHFLWNVLSPLVFVMIKWIVIGKYKPGRYPFWSSYYLRWWFVDSCRKIFGRGIWGGSNRLLIAFYRMLGANIAWDARLSIEADIAEFDLVTIGKDVSIEYATVRGFGLDNGAMQLGPVEVGNSASVGIRSIVAPGTKVPDGEHVAPGTSSYEIYKGDDRHLAYNRNAVEEPSLIFQLLVRFPITFLVDSFSHLPAMYVLYKMMVARTSSRDDGNSQFESIGDLLEWLCDPARIPYYLCIRIVRAAVAPFLYMVGALFVKWTIIGKFCPGSRDVTSQWDCMRHSLAATFFSREKIQDVTDLLGRHYELTSAFYRLLGAKVGRRVFWPGHQPLFSGEFDLLEIGDDVVFGSRSVILMTTNHSCENVVFCTGANISDNTIVLPGAIIGKNAVVGSNTVCPAGRYLPPLSTWVGSIAGEPVLLEANTEEDDGIKYSSGVKPSELEMIGDETTLRPFGRAVYSRKANYYVFPGWLMSMISIAYEAMMTCFHALPLLGAFFLTAGVFYGWPRADRDYKMEVSTWEVSKVMFLIFSTLHFGRVVMCLVIEIAAKWLFLGRRQQGRYNWYVFYIAVVVCLLETNY
jgi:acyl-CoA synthetase (AMP-forming)/AMP-acid ligase II/acetyltransferase-like isoleucine patch superfamily enzyme